MERSQMLGQESPNGEKILESRLNRQADGKLERLKREVLDVEAIAQRRSFVVDEPPPRNAEFLLLENTAAHQLDSGVRQRKDADRPLNRGSRQMSRCRSRQLNII